MYSWAIQQELWPDENPTKGIKRYRTYSRDRVIADSELVRLRTALPLLSPKLRAFIILLFCTACRMGEACRAKWEHLDLEAGRWIKPTTKNGRSHTLPLARHAVIALKALPREGEYVFAGFYGRPWSRAAAEKAWGRLRIGLGMKDMVLHDIRRSVASRLYEHERDPFLVKAILNHYDGSALAVYIRLQYDRIAAALQAHADRIFGDV
jgi:integrase